jgi:hypothetical protein
MGGATPDAVKRPICLYCLRTENEVAFSREHIIPEAIGGILVLNDAVCTECNSVLGSEVDVALLRDQEVLAALHAVGWEGVHRKTLAKQWRVMAESPQGPLLLSLGDGHFEVAPQSLQDGSQVRGEAFLGEWFEGQARAAGRRARGTLTPGAVEREIARLKVALATTDVDTPIRSKLFGRTLVKRHYPLKPEAVPRGAARVDRAIAKIAFEFAFFVVGRAIAKDPADNFEPFVRMVCRGTAGERVLIVRVKSEAEEFQPVHFVTLELRPGFTQLIVGLFRKITYLVIAPPLPGDSLDPIAAACALPPIRGVQCQVWPELKARRFGALLEDGGARLLCSY